MIGSCLRHRGTAIRALASAPHRLRLQRTHGRVSVSVSVSPARPDGKDDPKRRSVSLPLHFHAVVPHGVELARRRHTNLSCCDLARWYRSRCQVRQSAELLLLCA
jgi:hypothetical protein